MNDAIKEFMYTGCLSEAEAAKYVLICRYENKVSGRLLFIRDRLLEKGGEIFNEELRRTLFHPNPFLSFVKKQDFSGKYFPLPIKQ